MKSKRVRPVYGRGRATVELPFLVSCALFLLDRRFWILGLRYPLCGIRFDLLARLPSTAENVMLVEVKYRSDGRPVRPYEVRRFAKEVDRVRAMLDNCIVRGLFMTNTRFSDNAAKISVDKDILSFQRVPMLFDLRKGGKGLEGKSGEKENENTLNPFSSNVGNRAGRRGHP